MYSSYFDYYRRSIEFVQLQIYTFPLKWAVYSPYEPPPSWLKNVFESCAVLEVEISKAFKLVESIRAVVSHRTS